VFKRLYYFSVPEYFTVGREVYIDDLFINTHVGIEFNLFKNFYIGYNFEPNIYEMLNYVEEYPSRNLNLRLC
jgi:hypothetical protein